MGCVELLVMGMHTLDSVMGMHTLDSVVYGGFFTEIFEKLIVFSYALVDPDNPHTIFVMKK